MRALVKKGSKRSSAENHRLASLYKEMYRDLLDYSNEDKDNDERSLYGTQKLTPSVNMCAYRAKFAKVGYSEHYYLLLWTYIVHDRLLEDSKHYLVRNSGEMM